MRIEENVPLAPLTTLRLGGPARRLVTLEPRSGEAGADERAVVEAFAQLESERPAEPIFVLGGGSNLVVRDEGFAGTVVRFAPSQVLVERDAERVRIHAGAGVTWDELVAASIEAGGAGLECLSGIPGQAGASPIQNVGAYGQEVDDTLVEVRAYRRSDRTVHRLPASECRFAYRHSRFKEEPGWVVFGVTFELPRRAESGAIEYPELARALGIHLGDGAPLAKVRATVLQLRAGKGMVVDPADPESISAGSFFTNPILTEAEYDDLMDKCPEAPPRFDGGPGKVKTSAAWLIERAGFTRGYARGNVGISSKHALALVNRGGTATELLALADEIRQGVEERFGVTLVREPVLL